MSSSLPSKKVRYQYWSSHDDLVSEATGVLDVILLQLHLFFKLWCISSCPDIFSSGIKVFQRLFWALQISHNRLKSSPQCMISCCIVRSKASVFSSPILGRGSPVRALYGPLFVSVSALLIFTWRSLSQVQGVIVYVVCQISCTSYLGSSIFPLVLIQIHLELRESNVYSWNFFVTTYIAITWCSGHLVC